MAGMQFVARFVPFVFGLIGVLVIVSLWTMEGFGAPPLFFKLFGTLIASVFCLTGFGAAIHGPDRLNSGRPGEGRRRGKRNRRSAPSSAGGYTCPHCQGGLESGADVSPSGDVKCTFCDRWFNIHQ
ncbi:MAG: hypothetical protein ACI8QC_003402 [Planctomycetota bacterium]|jgi:hypothetical protein